MRLRRLLAWLKRIVTIKKHVPDAKSIRHALPINYYENYPNISTTSCAVITRMNIDNG